MFDFLKQIDESLENRYRTVVQTVKAASNSFYDSYLDMLETLIKIIAENAGLEDEEGKTCGTLAHSAPMALLLKDTIGIDAHSYGKILDYTAKVNKHKHHLEKNVSSDAVVNYLSVFYQVSSAYATYQKIPVTESFSSDYFLAIFGESERENKALKEECGKLKDELKEAIDSNKVSQEDSLKYKGLLDTAALEKLSLEEQNNELQKQISSLKDIKLSTMEEKLDKTISLLTNLEGYLVDSRAVSLGVGYTIVGKDNLKKYIDEAQEELKHDTKR